MERITWTESTRTLGELLPWAHNPRQIHGKQAERLLESIDEFGQVETIAIEPDNHILNGHQRVKVLMPKHGPTFVVAVRVSSRKLTERERQKLTVYLHKGAAGEWDFDALANTFDTDDLLAWGFEAAELGIEETPAEVADAEPQIDRADELRQKWGVSSGQLWALGDHRLICGDCTDAGVVARVMAGERADAIVTDPPYGIHYRSNQPAWDGTQRRTQREFGSDDFDATWIAVWADVLADDAPVYVFTRWDVLPLWKVALEDAGLKIKQRLIWDKSHFTMGDLDYYGSQTEDILFCIKGKPVLHWEQRRGNVIKTSSITYAPEGRTEHATQKPLAVIEPLVQDCAASGEIVSDPFSGSGTTLIACESLSRRCRAVEISPAYVAIALQRWHDATGKTPQLITES
jgi:DNA modification methylase